MAAGGRSLGRKVLSSLLPPAAARQLGAGAQALGFDDSALAVAAVEKALSQRQ